MLPKKFEATYIALLETSPIQARGYMVNAPNWITGGLRELVQWSETLKLFVADLPYSKEIGMEFKRPEKKHDIYGEMDD